MAVNSLGQLRRGWGGVATLFERLNRRRRKKNGGKRRAIWIIQGHAKKHPPSSWLPIQERRLHFICTSLSISLNTHTHAQYNLIYMTGDVNTISTLIDFELRRGKIWEHIAVAKSRRGACLNETSGIEKKNPAKYRRRSWDALNSSSGRWREKESEK